MSIQYFHLESNIAKNKIYQQALTRDFLSNIFCKYYELSRGYLVLYLDHNENYQHPNEHFQVYNEH